MVSEDVEAAVFDKMPEGRRQATCGQRHCSMSHWVVASWRKRQSDSNLHQCAAEELHPLLCQKHLSRCRWGRQGCDTPRVMHCEGALDLGES